MAFWLRSGMPLPWGGVPSTVGKIAFVSDRGGNPDLYMMDGADGANALALTKDDADDRQPVWSPSGTEIVFVSANRASGLGAGKNPVPQIAAMEAREGSSVVLLTRTSSTKELPVFGPEGRIFYLDAGKLISTNPDASDTDALFPPPDLRQIMQDFLSTGGLQSAESSPDGKKLLGVLKLEEGEALLMLNPEAETLRVLGIAERINAHFRADGSVVATFKNGSPLPKPALLFNADALKDPNFVLRPIEQKPPRGTHILAVFDGDDNPPTALALPSGPDEMRVSPDGKSVALATEEKSALVGVFILPLDTASGETPKKVTDQPARDLSWSPDGANVAYVSGDDIFTGRTDGGAPPKNLTQGKGRNSAPVWSPARKVESKPEK